VTLTLTRSDFIRCEETEDEHQSFIRWATVASKRSSRLSLIRWSVPDVLTRFLANQAAEIESGTDYDTVPCFKMKFQGSIFYTNC
jgi:hypothetical protein